MRRLIQLVGLMSLLWACFMLGLASGAPRTSLEGLGRALREPWHVLFVLRLFDDSLSAPDLGATPADGRPAQARRPARSPAAQPRPRPTRVAQAQATPAAVEPAASPPAAGDAAYANPQATPEPFAPRDVSNICAPDRARAEREFAELNRLRAEAGLPPMEWDESLYQPAVARAMDMASRGYLSHYDPVTGQALVPADQIAEVAGASEGTPSLFAARGWRNSPRHWEALTTTHRGAIAVVVCKRAIPTTVTEPGYPRERYAARMFAVGWSWW